MILLILALLFLFGASMLTMMMRSLTTLGRLETKKLFEIRPKLFFLYFLIKKFFPREKWDSLFFVTSFTKHILRILYAITAFLYLEPLDEILISRDLLIVASITAAGLLIEFSARLLTASKPASMLKFATPYASISVLFFSPISFLLLKVQRLLFVPRKKSESKVRETILELVQESELAGMLSPLDRKLITSVASFRERIVKEIMVPRIDAFIVSAEKSLKEVVQEFLEEGYSRIPVYQESVDKVVGVILYKDVMKILYTCIQEGNASRLNVPLGELITPILYTPETKKISALLQEFRRRQIHIAIVVDEYGGTEGIVTIEDILEELVGEIADEYDFDEEVPFAEHEQGGWSVDAKMNILDIEKELGIEIPPSPEYDTIGGYIFHKAGTIPEKGWRLHHDNFDLEVIDSSERTVEKIWIIPHAK